MQKKILFVLLSIVFLTTCHSDKKTIKSDGMAVRSNVSTEIFDQDIISCPIGGFSSPIDMASFVQEIGIPFSMKYLCPTEHINKYDTDFKKAFGLGLLNSDLGYLNIYEKTSALMNYINAIKSMAEDIHIGQFMDF